MAAGSQRLRLFAALITLGVVGAAACRSTPTENAPPSAGQASPAAPAAVASSAIGGVASTSSLPAFDIDCESEMMLGAQHVVARLRGKLARRSGIGSDRDSWEVWALGDAVATAQTDTGENRTLGALPEPFYVTRDGQGNPSQLRVSTEYDAVQRRLLETLVGALRFPERLPPGSKWQARERDNLGWHVARYERLAGGLLSRTKGDYERAARGLRWQVQESAWQATLDEAGTLSSLVGREALQGKSDPLIVDYKVKLRATRSGATVELATSALEAVPDRYVELDFGRAGQKSTREKDEFVAKGRTWDDTMRALSVRTKGGPSWDELYMSAAFLRLHPEDVSRVVSLVEKEPELLVNAVAVLGETGSEPAQHALVGWLAQLRQTDPTKADAILEATLRRVTRPLPVLLEHLLAGATSEKGETQRALIDATALAVARASEQGAPEAASYTARLIEAGRAATEPAVRGQVLASLGRIKRPAALTELLEQSRDGVLLVRSGAIAGLGTHGDAAAQARLIELVLKDAEPPLRMAAAQSLGFEAVKQYRAELLRAYQSEKLEIVRIDLVRALGRLVRTEPSIRAALRRFSSTESSASVRGELERALQKKTAT